MQLTIDTDDKDLRAAYKRLGEAASRRTQEAARTTAEAILREAKGRLARQLGPAATGQTVAGIVAQPADDGNGWVVLADRDPFPNLPLWLEKGTQPGKRRNRASTRPRPFFYSSAELESANHFRRILTALNDAIAEEGLGE